MDITMSSAAAITVQTLHTSEQSTGIEDSSDSLQRISNSGMVPFIFMRNVVFRLSQSVRERTKS